MKIERLKNNRKILLGTVIVFVVILTLIITTSLAKYKVTESINIAKGTINYSPYDISIMGIYIESESGYTQSDTIPESGYELNETESYCKQGDTKLEVLITYDMNSKELQITPMTQKGTKCYLYFDEKTLTGSNTIISLVGNGQVFDEGDVGYRYEGVDVNNYVEFNNETWRILAVEEGSKIGLTSGEYYIKLIRDESIGDYIAWDTNYYNVWSTSSLYSLLNNDYLNKTGDYSSIGISSEALSQIEKANWYTNGVSSEEYSASQFYSYERADTTQYVNNYVGLMYASDYGYASPNSTCGSVLLSAFYSSGCYQSNWLFKSDNNYWTLTPLLPLNSDGVFLILDAGYVRSYYAYYGSGVRPSVYLKADITFVEGTTGSSSNMFKIVG